MKSGFMRRVAYAVAGGLPASYLLWLATERVFSGEQPSSMFTLVWAVAAAATISGWLAIVGVKSKIAALSTLQLALVAAGTIEAIVMGVATKFILFVAVAVVGACLTVELLPNKARST